MANAYDKDKIVLFKKLCFSLLGDDKDKLERVFQRGLESLASFDEAEFHTSFSPWEEYEINDRIEKILREKYPNAEEAVSRFQALSRSLRDISEDSDSYAEQLLFLLRMSEQNTSSRFELPCFQENEINGNISNFEATADSFDETNFSLQNWNTNSSLPPESSNVTVFREGTNGSSHRSEKNSVHSEATKTITNVQAVLERKLQIDGVLDSPIQKKFPTHHLFTDTPITEPTATSSRKGSSNKTNNVMRKHVDSVSSLEGTECPRPSALSISRNSSSKKNDNEATEREIMKELVFCMQGIEGKIIQYKSVDEGFYLNPQIKIDQPYMVLHLMELGFLHNQIKQFISTLFVDAGTVAQGLLTAIRREMSEYYQAIATLDSQLNPSAEIADTPLSEEECAKFNLPTLSQIFVWSRDPLLKLQTLLDVLNAVQNKCGGEIISDLAFLSYHGNPKIKKIITKLLASAILPFYKQIFYWVVNGEMIDSRGEFFIQMENPVEAADLKDAWDKQYVLRPSMIPKYMSLEEANQILETGRCMNFLHNNCHQRPAPTPAQVMLSELEKNKWSDPVALIKPGNDVSELISKAYKEVSKNVLNTLNENFKMQTHFEALRKYMLLGQGDFIHYLLEIIEPDLNKCVAALHTYTLMRSVEDAVFKSNAQFDDSDVLSKLCVKMLVTSEQENVSEAFCLQYRLDGPLNTIFKCSCVGYNRMFTFMWRVKRANCMVLKMWRGLKLLHKEVHRLIPETRPVFMKANYLVMEMVNFIGHFQYYIASEVVEVSWRKFRSELEKMESLEKVLQAHNEFLESMQSSCMLNTKPGSVQATMTWHIRSLLDYVQELVPIVEMFQSIAQTEVERRRTRQETVARAGISSQGEHDNEISTMKFSDEMSKVKTKFKVLANQYQEKLKSLLVLFSENQEEHNLILLSHRIDFNEFYKQNDARLSDSLKLHKRF